MYAAMREHGDGDGPDGIVDELPTRVAIGGVEVIVLRRDIDGRLDVLLPSGRIVTVLNQVASSPTTVVGDVAHPCEQ